MSENVDSGEASEAFKKVFEKGTDAQRDFLNKFSTIQQDVVQNFFSMLQSLTYYNAMFKTTVQTGGRISIPEAERKALRIEDGDLVQVILIPIGKKPKGINSK